MIGESFRVYWLLGQSPGLKQPHSSSSFILEQLSTNITFHDSLQMVLSLYTRNTDQLCLSPYKNKADSRCCPK